MIEVTDRDRATIKAFDERIRKTFETGQRKGKLEDIGNFSVVVHPEAVWTVITQGPRAGVHAEMTDDEMAFMLITTPDVFTVMHSEDEAEIEGFDLDAVMEQNKVAMHGDVEVYMRFVALGQADDMLSLRTGGTPSKGTNLRAKKLKKRRGTV